MHLFDLHGALEGGLYLWVFANFGLHGIDLCLNHLKDPIHNRVKCLLDLLSRYCYFRKGRHGSEIIPTEALERHVKLPGQAVSAIELGLNPVLPLVV